MCHQLLTLETTILFYYSPLSTQPLFYLLFVSLNNKLVALIGVKDILKDNIENVIKELKDKNINVVMLTGDNEKTAEIVAKQIGIEKVISNVTPKEKAEKIKELKKDGIVIMCGDGMKFRFDANQDKPAKYRRIVLKLAPIGLELLQISDGLAKYLPWLDCCAGAQFACVAAM